MKNLMINQDFIAKAALLDGDETKQLLLWCYNYAVNDVMPTDDELDASQESLYNSFSEYIKYIDVCKKKYEDRVQRTLQEQEMENNEK